MKRMISVALVAVWLFGSSTLRAVDCVYVANNRSNNVSVINTSVNTVMAVVPVGESPVAMALARDGKKYMWRILIAVA